MTTLVVTYTVNNVQQTQTFQDNLLSIHYAKDANLELYGYVTDDDDDNQSIQRLLSIPMSSIDDLTIS